MSLGALKKLGKITPISGAISNTDSSPDFGETPLVHGADTAAQGGMSSIVWKSKSMNGPGHLASLAAWNRSTAVNLNASSSQFRTAPPPGGGA
jgi:hypothetical protein